MMACLRKLSKRQGLTGFWASGLTISADTLINQEICGPTALYYNPSDATSLANRVEELLNRPDLYRWMAENGEKRVKEKFSWQGHAGRLISILEDTARTETKV